MLAKKFSLLLIFSVILTLGLSISLGSLLAAWTAPVSAPPQGNIAAPINTSTTGQAKQGGLIINTGDSANGLIVQFGNVGIGTTLPSPSYKLDVVGDLRISGGGAFGGYTPSATYKLTTPTLYAEQAQVGNPAGGLKGAGSVNASSVCIEGVCQSSWPGIGGTSGWTDDGAVIRLTTISDSVGIGTTIPGAKLEVNGNIIASAPTANNHVTTKEYVDSMVEAAGTGQATCSDSVQEGTWFSGGGNSRYCQKRVIDSSGLATITNINQGLKCENNGYCSNGTCVFSIISFYKTSTVNSGNLGGRAGADATCLSQKPTDLTCAKLHAFISINGTDEIRDMPTNYGYSVDKEMTWYNSTSGVFTKFANNWADMLDGSILASANTGLGSNVAWTGSESNGAVTGNCNAFTSSSSGVCGWNGYGNFVDSWWIHYACSTASSGLCSSSNNVIFCACE